MYKKFLTIVSGLVLFVSVCSAGMPSWNLSYEEKAPESLKKYMK